jgi:hypothetical protein
MQEFALRQVNSRDVCCKLAYSLKYMASKGLIKVNTPSTGEHIWYDRRSEEERKAYESAIEAARKRYTRDLLAKYKLRGGADDVMMAEVAAGRLVIDNYFMGPTLKTAAPVTRSNIQMVRACVTKMTTVTFNKRPALKYTFRIHNSYKLNDFAYPFMDPPTSTNQLD